MSLSTKTADIVAHICEFSINFNELEIPVSHVEKVLGYDNGNGSDHFQKMIHDVISEASQYCNIKGGFRVLNDLTFSENGTGLELDGKYVDSKKVINKQLRGSETAAVFLCTVGPEMEKWSKQLMDSGELVKGYIVDAVASVTVESAMNKIQDILKQKQVSNGQHITHRFSPGYCGWPVSDQKVLFSFFPEQFCGITLTESSLMLPIKSISGIVGIGREAKKRAYPCKICKMEHCFQKKIIQEVN